ncbi:MAG TPA: hypothetical protein VGT60_02825 [Candidatus Limnocylindria bacterium]|nr:hypothetical protein [Candidatus Limnocylindria bacterium]
MTEAVRIGMAALLMIASGLALGRPAHAAACASSVGPGVPPPASVPAGIPGFHAAWYGQSGYMSLCPGDRMTATVAYYNSGSRGWVAGRMGEVAYLGTAASDPGKDAPSIVGGDGALGSPATGWPRYDRPAVQPAAYVGPGQVAWFQFTVQAPGTPGTYRVAIRPLVEGAQWLEDYGVFWQITVLNADGSAAAATPGDPRGMYFAVGPGVDAQSIADVHEGIARVSAFLGRSVGGDRSRTATTRIDTGAATYCCLAQLDGIAIVTGNSEWVSPRAAAADTWTADTERTELAAHEYVHVWQGELGGNACMLGPRWLSEGMAESLAYRSLAAAGLIPQANLDTFTRRQLSTATTHPTLAQLETQWNDSANPYSVAYLAVDRLLAANGPLPLRSWCEAVGRGVEWHAAFAQAFGETTDAFYARFESYKAGYLR